MSIPWDSNKKEPTHHGGFLDAAKNSPDLWHLSEGAKKKKKTTKNNICAFKKVVNHALNVHHLHFK